ncbi:MATE family efflux transporter [Sedimentibacter sp. zth1]|uniref:MATE family efflux transporter n=1 Tax=Sedimentibacter sp. zth1 TaxID=2816908 RepID=UPI001A92294F|nr:MATE family efflux transporter [Sedimentibacter sp. zth1]QSX06992.1 MATE family efflux transporter [Sedimentibacter sp. zth1]
MIKEKENYTKLINNMALPILLNYILLTLFEVLDKAIVGRYSTTGFAAVGIASKIIYTLTGTLGIISVAYNILAAKLKSEHNDEKFNKLFNVVMTISIAIGLLFIVIALVFGKELFINAYRLKGEIAVFSVDYFYISSFTVLLNLATFIFSVYFRNQQNTKVSFYSTFVATVINIFFDISLVYGKFGFKEFGVKGAAYGSVIGLVAGILVYIFVLIKKYKLKFVFSFDGSCIKKLFKLYVPLLFQDFIEATVFVMMLMAIVSRLSVSDIASFNLLESIGSLIILPAFAFAQSSMTLAIQYNKKEISNKILTIATFETVFLITLLCIFVIFNPKLTFGFITKDGHLIEKSTKIFWLVIIIQIINSILQILKCFLQGIGHEKFVLKITSIISITSIIWIFALANLYGLNGIYVGIIINYLICVIIYFFKIRKVNN